MSGLDPTAAIPATVTPPPAPASTSSSGSDTALMTPATRQFAIKCAVVTLCVVLGVIVGTQAALILLLHDGAATASVVTHLTNMGYGIVGALIILVGGPHIAASLVAAFKSTGVGGAP